MKIIPFDVTLTHILNSKNDLEMNSNLIFSLKRDFESSSLIPIIDGIENEKNLNLFIKILNEIYEEFKELQNLQDLTTEFFVKRKKLLNLFSNFNKNSKGK